MKSHTFTALHHCVFTACFCASSLAFAQQSTDAPAAAIVPGIATNQTHPVGAATKALLIMQSSNVSAAPVRAGGGEEASLAYHRYLESFKHPIPTFFASSTGKANGASGGTAN